MRNRDVPVVRFLRRARGWLAAFLSLRWRAVTVAQVLGILVRAHRLQTRLAQQSLVAYPAVIDLGDQRGLDPVRVARGIFGVLNLRARRLVLAERLAQIE